MKLVRARLPLVLLIFCSIVAGACGRSGEKPSAAASSGGGGGTSAAPSTSAAAPAKATGTIDVWTYPQGDDEKPIKAVIKAFETQNPQAKVKLLVIPEGDPYYQKLNTALRAKKPPDVAIIEERSWMKTGQALNLTSYYSQWGVKVEDFNPGGLSRATVDGDISKGVYAVGEFLGGNVFVYNKKLFDAAGVALPPTDRSLTIQEYADICRKLAKPDPNPTKAIWGCSMPEWAPPIQVKDVFGPDGKHALGNMNSPEMIEAFNVASALVRDKMAPSGSQLEAAGESDLFAQGRLGISWTDFTEIDKYKAQKIDFGLAPFLVIKQGESFVDTWTAPWGTFKDSKNQAGALAFLRFIATDGQTVRMKNSPDPALNTKVAEQENYGNGDPIKQEYLAVLKAAAKPQVFVPPGVNAWDPAEVLRQMTVEKKTDAKPILDVMAQKSQKELDEVWKRWDKLGGG